MSSVDALSRRRTQFHVWTTTDQQQYFLLSVTIVGITSWRDLFLSACPPDPPQSNLFPNNSSHLYIAKLFLNHIDHMIHNNTKENARNTIEAVERGGNNSRDLFHKEQKTYFYGQKSYFCGASHSETSFSAKTQPFELSLNFLDRTEYRL
jgi:hypothetical protein